MLGDDRLSVTAELLRVVGCVTEDSICLGRSVQELFAVDCVLEAAEKLFLDVGAFDFDDELLVFFVLGCAVDGDHVRGEVFFFGFVVAERMAGRVGRGEFKLDYAVSFDTQIL